MNQSILEIIFSRWNDEAGEIERQFFAELQMLIDRTRTFLGVGPSGLARKFLPMEFNSVLFSTSFEKKDLLLGLSEGLWHDCFSTTENDAL